MPCRNAMLVPTNHMGWVSGGGLAALYAFQKKEEEEEEGEGLLCLLACFALLACFPLCLLGLAILSPMAAVAPRPYGPCCPHGTYGPNYTTIFPLISSQLSSATDSRP